MSDRHRAAADGISTEPLWLFAPDRPWAPLLSGLTMLAIIALAATGLVSALSDMGTVPAPSTGGAATPVMHPGPGGDR